METISHRIKVWRRRKYLGYPDLARDAAKLGLATAQRLDDPAILGVAQFFSAHALPAEIAALAGRITASAADDIQPQISDPDARQTYGYVSVRFQ